MNRFSSAFLSLSGSVVAVDLSEALGAAVAFAFGVLLLHVARFAAGAGGCNPAVVLLRFRT